MVPLHGLLRNGSIPRELEPTDAPTDAAIRATSPANARVDLAFLLGEAPGVKVVVDSFVAVVGRVAWFDVLGCSGAGGDVGYCSSRSRDATSLKYCFQGAKVMTSSETCRRLRVQIFARR